MCEKVLTFREKLGSARPNLVKRQAKNARKRAIAIELRALRDTRGLSQTEVAEIGGMTLSMIARLEALTGRVPRLELIESYVQACGGHMALHISRDRFER